MVGRKERMMGERWKMRGNKEEEGGDRRGVAWESWEYKPLAVK